MAVTHVSGKLFNDQAVEINAALHCNLSCASCSHLSPVFHKSFADAAVVKQDLQALARYYRAATCKIVGGEPLLHPDLPGLLRAVRDSNVADAVTIVTNGLRIEKMPDAAWHLVNAIEVSLYPEVAPNTEALHAAANRAQQLGVEFVVNHFANFRLSHTAIKTTDDSIVRDIFHSCKVVHDWQCHTVEDGWFYRCPQSVFIPRGLGLQEAVPGRDGVALNGEQDLGERLAACLDRNEPLEGCGHCLGTVGRLEKHSQGSRRDWIENQPADDLLDRDFMEASLLDITVGDGCVVTGVVPTPKATTC